MLLRVSRVTLLCRRWRSRSLSFLLLEEAGNLATRLAGGGLLAGDVAADLASKRFVLAQDRLDGAVRDHHADAAGVVHVLKENGVLRSRLLFAVFATAT